MPRVKNSDPGKPQDKTENIMVSPENDFFNNLNPTGQVQTSQVSKIPRIQGSNVTRFMVQGLKVPWLQGSKLSKSKIS